MDTVQLRVKNMGIYPDYDRGTENELQRMQRKFLELRARTKLAFAYTNKHALLREVPVEDGRMVLLSDGSMEFEKSDISWSVTKDTNTGFVDVNPERNAVWAHVPCRMFLYLDNEINVEMLLAFYLGVPLRFLHENSFQNELLMKSYAVEQRA